MGASHNHRCYQDDIYFCSAPAVLSGRRPWPKQSETTPMERLGNGTGSFITNLASRRTSLQFLASVRGGPSCGEKTGSQLYGVMHFYMHWDIPTIRSSFAFGYLVWSSILVIMASVKLYILGRRWLQLGRAATALNNRMRTK